jgi:hypothetical protein
MGIAGMGYGVTGLYQEASYSFTPAGYEFGASVMRVTVGRIPMAPGGFEYGGGDLTDPLTLHDPYFSSVVFLCSFDGANNSTSFTDDSPVGRTLTPVNNAKVSTSQFVFGGASAFFDGINDAVEAADSNDWHLFNSVADEFTVEGWFRATALSSDRFICGQAGWSIGTQISWAVYVESGQLVFYYRVASGGPNVIITSSGAGITTNTWYHFAVDKSSAGVFRLYINGVMVGTATPATQTLNNSTVAFRVGLSANNLSDFAGHIDELRITKGVARYKSNSGFTVPTAAYPKS